jgi:formate hydrogenlyase transcriptional activator
MVDRVGGTQPISVDVRLIAATNADLTAGVSKGLFRADLFYRLHIFPISVPPLRERRQDIILLAQHFLSRLGVKMNRPQLKFDAPSLQRLMDYNWPGNVRELQNVIERAVILSHSSTISVDEVFLPASTVSLPQEEHSLNLGELERTHILKVLEQTNWRIYGTGGAAELLGLNPETLRSRIRKLGIRRPSR